MYIREKRVGRGDLTANIGIAANSIVLSGGRGGPRTMSPVASGMSSTDSCAT